MSEQWVGYSDLIDYVVSDGGGTRVAVPLAKAPAVVQAMLCGSSSRHLVVRCCHII